MAPRGKSSWNKFVAQHFHDRALAHMEARDRFAAIAAMWHGGRARSRSPGRKSPSRSPRRKSKSPRRKSKSPRRKSKSPRRKSVSPRRKSKSPRRKSKSPRRKSKSPRRRSKSPRRRSVCNTQGKAACDAKPNCNWVKRSPAHKAYCRKNPR